MPNTSLSQTCAHVSSCRGLFLSFFVARLLPFFRKRAAHVCRPRGPPSATCVLAQQRQHLHVERRVQVVGLRGRLPNTWSVEGAAYCTVLSNRACVAEHSEATIIAYSPA